MNKGGYDIRIYYSGSAYVSGHCSRWDVSNYALICELWLKKDSFNVLNNNIRPGAVKELKRVIDSPKYYDSSWTGKNTVKLKPVEETELYRMRGKEKIMYPKGITSSPLPGDKGWLEVKLEGVISGGSI